MPQCRDVTVITKFKLISSFTERRREKGCGTLLYTEKGCGVGGGQLGGPPAAIAE